jgi:hypothetical protein
VRHSLECASHNDNFSRLCRRIVEGFLLVLVGPCIFVFGHALFPCPETYFQRPAVAFDGHILVQGPTETIMVS